MSDGSGTRVTAEDIDSGDKLARVIKDDYNLVCDGDCYVSGIQTYANGTHVITVKPRRGETVSTSDDLLPGETVPRRLVWKRGKHVPEFPEECEPHTPHPEGYLAHMEWMEKMAATHNQRQCTGCGLWAVWELKDSSEEKR